jgi:IS1 family transposase
MKTLDRETRSRCLHALCEGMAIRAVARLTGVSKTTLLKLVADSGRACAWYQDRVFRNLACKRIQVDELWGFVHAKQKNVPAAKRAPEGAGDVWLWVATDADTKLVPSWYVGGRDSDSAIVIMDDLASRLAGRVQLTTDGHKAYLEAVEGAFGGDIDYAMLVKLYGPSPDGPRRYSPAECIGAVKTRIEGNPDLDHVSTSYAERNNLNVRMHSRRLTRLTNAFSKKVENHAHAMALHFMYYNFVRIHKTLRITPAMAAGATKRLWEIGDIVDVLEAWEQSSLRK